MQGSEGKEQLRVWDCDMEPPLLPWEMKVLAEEKGFQVLEVGEERGKEFSCHTENWNFQFQAAVIEISTQI